VTVPHLEDVFTEGKDANRYAFLTSELLHVALFWRQFTHKNLTGVWVRLRASMNRAAKRKVPPLPTIESRVVRFRASHFTVKYPSS